MNRISFLNRGYAFKGLLAVIYQTMCFHKVTVDRSAKCNNNYLLSKSLNVLKT